MNQIYQIFEDKLITKSWKQHIPKEIIKDAYKIFYEDKSQRKMQFDDVYYIIGLSEDRYDYYWICINNKDQKLKFITCVYNLLDNPNCNITKKFNKEECQNILKEIKEYFRKNSLRENLIYLDEKLWNTNRNNIIKN